MAVSDEQVEIALCDAVLMRFATLFDQDPSRACSLTRLEAAPGYPDDAGRWSYVVTSAQSETRTGTVWFRDDPYRRVYVTLDDGDIERVI